MISSRRLRFVLTLLSLSLFLTVDAWAQRALPLDEMAPNLTSIQRALNPIFYLISMGFAFRGIALFYRFSRDPSTSLSPAIGSIFIAMVLFGVPSMMSSLAPDALPASASVASASVSPSVAASSPDLSAPVPASDSAPFDLGGEGGFSSRH